MKPSSGQQQSIARAMKTMELIQLFCEGHYRPMQDTIREQPMHSININLIDDVIKIIFILVRFHSPSAGPFLAPASSKSQARETCPRRAFRPLFAATTSYPCAAG